MTTLSAEKFLKITWENPQWAKTLTENVMITGKVILPKDHPLKALSPKLVFQNHATFIKSQISIAEGVFHQGVDFSKSKIQEIGELSVLGTNKIGDAASFEGCCHLAVARGTFPGFVDFSESGIQEIAEDLSITTPDKYGNGASFWGCKNLTVARGTFPGFVTFKNSEIQKIANDFRVDAPDKEGNAVSFNNCKRLTIAKGTFPGHVNFNQSGIREISKEFHVTAPNNCGNAANFACCANLGIASGTFSGTVNFSVTPIVRTQNLKIIAPEGKPKAIFTELCLEESPFPLEEIQIPEELKKKLHRKIIQKLHKNLEDHFPSIPQDI